MTTVTIGIEEKDGTICFRQQTDGHPTRLGKLLLKQYAAEDATKKMIGSAVVKAASIKAYLTSAFREKSAKYAYLYKDRQWWIAEDSDSPLRPLIINI